MVPLHKAILRFLSYLHIYFLTTFQKHKSSVVFIHLQNVGSHYYAENVLIHVALAAISTTLAIYCCKVVNCCAPAPKVVG